VADLFNVVFSGSLPTSFSSVNTGGNTFNFSGPNAYGAHFRNNSTDGSNILGIYVNSGFQVQSSPGRVYECSFVSNSLYTQDGRGYWLAIQLATGLDMNNITTFGIRRDQTAGISAVMEGGLSVSDPFDAIYFQYTKDAIYTGRIIMQGDGTAKAYVEGPGTGGQLLLGSSYISTAPQALWPAGTDVFMSTNSFKSWTSGGGGLEVNNFRVYDPTGSDGENLLVLGHL